MARGRFISNTLGRSKKYNMLPDHFAKLVYVHTLTMADEQGRIEADPISIYGDHFVVDPEANLERIEAALQACHAVGLIQLYEVSGKRYAQFCDFHRHNVIYRKKDGTPQREGASQIPAPQDDCTDTAQLLHSSSAVSYYKDKGKDKDKVQVQDKETTSSSDDDVYWKIVEAWNQNCGTLSKVQTLNTPRRRQLKTFLKDMGSPQEAYAVMAIAAKEVSNDPFWKQRGFGFNNIMADQRVVQKAETAYNRGSFDQGQAEIDRMLAALGGNDA